MSDHSGGGEAPRAGMKWTCKHCHYEIPNIPPEFPLRFCPNCQKEQSEVTHTEKQSKSESKTSNENISQKSLCRECKMELMTPTVNTCLKCNTVQNPNLRLNLPAKPDAKVPSQAQSEGLSSQEVPDLPDPRDLSKSGAIHDQLSNDELTRRGLKVRKRSGSSSSIDSSTNKKSCEANAPIPLSSPQFKRRNEDQEPPHDELNTTPGSALPQPKRQKKSTESDKQPVNELKKEQAEGASVHDGTQKDGTSKQQTTTQRGHQPSSRTKGQSSDPKPSSSEKVKTDKSESEGGKNQNNRKV